MDMKINLGTNKDLALFLNCLENEMMMYQRQDAIQGILSKLKDINLEAYGAIFNNIEELNRFKQD